MTMFKAVRPDGTDFFAGTVQWAPPVGHEGEWIVRHPTSTKIGGYAGTYLSVSTAPANCTGMWWPCRLLTVEPISEARGVDDMPNKRAGLAFRVTGERPAWEALGPNGEAVAALVDRASRLSVAEVERMATAWAAARDAARDAAEAAAEDAAWDADQTAAWAAGRDAARVSAGADAWGAAGADAWDAAEADAWGAAEEAAGDAAGAVLVRDLITPDQYATLTEPWAAVIGPAHPDDTQATK